jgi:hypothetical protein
MPRSQPSEPGFRSLAGLAARMPTIINKITTNTVEIASIRIYARALQFSVEIARLGPAARDDALTIRTVDAYPLSAATRGAEASRGPPRPSQAAQAAAWL